MRRCVVRARYRAELALTSLGVLWAYARGGLSGPNTPWLTRALFRVADWVGPAEG